LPSTTAAESDGTGEGVCAEFAMGNETIQAITEESSSFMQISTWPTSQLLAAIMAPTRGSGTRPRLYPRESFRHNNKTPQRMR